MDFNMPSRQLLALAHTTSSRTSSADCQDIDFHTLQNFDTIHDTELTLFVLVTNFPNVIIYARHAIALANFDVEKQPRARERAKEKNLLQFLFLDST